VLDVSAGIAPFPAPPAALRAYRRAASDLAHYPEIEGASLRRALAACLGLASENVLVGGGTTEFIYLIPRALKPGRVLGFVPAYRDYADAARLVGHSLVAVPTRREENFARDLRRLDAVLRAGDLIFLGNPNNPTGDLIPPAELRAFCARHPRVTAVVDEAYIDFIGPAASCLTPKLPPNLLILRSPTKFYAVPGVRLGYCLGPAATIARLLDAKEPWTASAPALAVGLALLRCAGYDARVRRWLKRAKPALLKLLAAVPGLTVYSGAANYLLCRIQADRPTAAELRAACLERGLLIRDASNFEGLDSHYFRVAVRAPAENRRLARIIRETLADFSA
jgi:threonine-phosphate decarboxylase